MYRLAASVFLFFTAATTSAWAHEGHGAAFVHLHWWEYGLLAAVIVGVVLYAARK